MTHAPHLAPAVTGVPDAADAARQRGIHQHRGGLASHRSADPGDPYGPAPDTELNAIHRSARFVVEIEPGDMAVTDMMRTRLATDSTLIGVASDAAAVGRLRRTEPWLTVLQGDATNLRHVLNTAGIARVHLVIDTLSPALMAEATQRRVIDSVAGVLHPDGGFAVAVALPVRLPLAVQRLRRRLGEVFSEVTRTDVGWDRAAATYLLVARNPTRPPVDMRHGEHFASAHTDVSAAA